MAGVGNYSRILWHTNDPPRLKKGLKKVLNILVMVNIPDDDRAGNDCPPFHGRPQLRA
jgi:hypothetical protein